MAPREELHRRLSADFPRWTVHELAGDASTRRFFRLASPRGESRIVMDYGRPFEGETDDVTLSRIFREAGLPSAEVLGVFPEPGFLLVEDLGDHLLERALTEIPKQAENEPPAPLTEAARLAARIARYGTPVLARTGRAGALDAERFRFEMDFFLEHFAVAVRDRSQALPALREPLYRLADLAAGSSPPVLCHRDFHSRNLLVRDDGSLGMVDIQDARWGPDSYDLASLLYDAYADIDPGWFEVLIGAFMDALEDAPEPAAFRRRLDLVAAQRMIKALGTFGFQQTSRGSTRYLPAADRTRRRLRALLPTLERPRGLWPALESAAVLD